MNIFTYYEIEKPQPGTLSSITNLSRTAPPFPPTQIFRELAQRFRLYAILQQILPETHVSRFSESSSTIDVCEPSIPLPSTDARENALNLELQGRLAQVMQC